MIAYLNGKLIDKRDGSLVVDVQGVGYEVFCSSSTVDRVGTAGTSCQLFIHAQYRADGASLFGFLSAPEKALFLSLTKVDTVGPKSALNIMSAAPWDELVSLIEEGNIAALSKLPKISKKTAELVCVKLKGKLGELLLLGEGASTPSGTPLSGSAGPSPSVVSRREKSSAIRRLRTEAQTALSHLGYRSQDVDRTLNDLSDDVWNGDVQAVIRQALNHLSGN